MPSSLLILTHEYPPRRGGIATYVAESATAAAALGWDVTVAAPRTAKPIDRPGFTVCPLPLAGTQGWPDRWRLRQWLRGLDRDWADTTLWLPEPGPIRLWMYADWLRLPSPGRLILTFHGSELRVLGGRRHRRKRLARLLTRADRIGVVSDAVATLARQSTPILRDDVLVQVPGAVATDLAAALARTAPRAKPANGDLRVLTVGRIHPRKGQLHVIEALARLEPEWRQRVVYTLVGPVRRPGYAVLLERRARELGVRLEGPVEAANPTELAAAYRSADLFVLASEDQARSVEGFGLVFLEAAAAACPVIGTDAGGMREAIGPANGLVVPSQDPAALTDALRTLLQDPARRHALGAAGPEWAARFSWTANLQRLLA